MKYLNGVFKILVGGTPTRGCGGRIWPLFKILGAWPKIFPFYEDTNRDDRRAATHSIFNIKTTRSNLRDTLEAMGAKRPLQF